MEEESVSDIQRDTSNAILNRVLIGKYTVHGVIGTTGKPALDLVVTASSVELVKSAYFLKMAAITVKEFLSWNVFATTHLVISLAPIAGGLHGRLGLLVQLPATKEGENDCVMSQYIRLMEVVLARGSRLSRSHAIPLRAKRQGKSIVFGPNGVRGRPANLSAGEAA